MRKIRRQNLNSKKLIALYTFSMAGMGMIKQNNARKAEKALNEILDKADSNANGRVELKDFMDILEANGVEVRKKSTLS